MSGRNSLLIDQAYFEARFDAEVVADGNDDSQVIELLDHEQSGLRKFSSG